MATSWPNDAWWTACRASKLCSTSFSYLWWPWSWNTWISLGKGGSWEGVQRGNSETSRYFSFVSHQTKQCFSLPARHSADDVMFQLCFMAIALGIKVVLRLVWFSGVLESVISPIQMFFNAEIDKQHRWWSWGVHKFFCPQAILYLLFFNNRRASLWALPTQGNGATFIVKNAFTE